MFGASLKELSNFNEISYFREFRGGLTVDSSKFPGRTYSAGKVPTASDKSAEYDKFVDENSEEVFTRELRRFQRRTQIRKTLK